MYGPCRKRDSKGNLDDCQEYEQSSDPNSKLCEACGCHRGFHSRIATTPNALVSLAQVTESMSHVEEMPCHINTSTNNLESSSHLDSSTPTPSDTGTPSSNQQYNYLSNFPEYPDGDICIELEGHNYDDYGNTGWATICISNWKLKSDRGKARKLRCLGVLVCMAKDCNYVKRPNQKKQRLNEQLQELTCQIHGSKLQHIDCDATLTWKEYVTSLTTTKHVMIHNKHHKHPKPPSVRPPPSAFRQFEHQVLTAPSSTPKQLIIGSSFSSSVRDIHSSFSNLDRLGFHRRKVLKRAKTNSYLTNVLEWQTKHPNFIINSSINSQHGYIFMQSTQQANWCGSFAGPLQTDALESFVEGPGNTVLCVTSGYIEIIGRTVPLAASILFGKSEQHYRQHFHYLFKSLNMKLEESKDKEHTDQEINSNWSLNWTCMVVDFSTAQHMAFLHEFKEAVLLNNPMIENMDPHKLAQSYIRGCQIHYFRSAVRVARIQSVVPPSKTELFIQLTTELVNCDLQRFVLVMKQLKNEYPLATKWLNWYLHEDRARLIFKSYTLLGDKWNCTVGNTNAQEGTGKDIKYTAVKTSLPLFEVIDHLHRYVQTIHQDMETVISGGKIRYKRKQLQKKRKRNFVHNNDGRPPDTSIQLVPEGLLTSSTAYKMARKANLQSSDSILRNDPTSKIDFLKNKHACCYASSVLFILFQIKIYYLINSVTEAWKIDTPSSIQQLLSILVKCQEHKLEEARKMLLSYIWNHPDGAPKNKHMSFTKFITVYLEPTSSSSSHLSELFYRNLIGISYIQHTKCACGINSNKVVYNTLYEITIHQLNSLDDTMEGTDLETIINYRHHHSHDISICPKCSNERQQWYTIVNIPNILIINFEGIRSVGQHEVRVPLVMTIGCNSHPMKLKCVGFISHVDKPQHWTSTVIDGETTYFYDDLVGYATQQTLNISELSDSSTSAVVYVRDYENDTKTQQIEILVGKSVHILNDNKTVIAEGIVTNQFIDDIAIVLVTCVHDTKHKLSFIFRANSSIFINDWKNNHIVWRASMLRSNVVAEPMPDSPSITVNPPPPPKRPRLRLPQKYVPSSESVVSSEYDIELERIKAKTRRLAKQIK